MKKLNESQILDAICDALEGDGIEYDLRPDEGLFLFSSYDDFDNALFDVESIVGDAYFADDAEWAIHVDDFFKDSDLDEAKVVATVADDSGTYHSEVVADNISDEQAEDKAAELRAQGIGATIELDEDEENLDIDAITDFTDID